MSSTKVRIPKQKRGIKTKEKIIKTAFRLIAEKGIHGTNSNEIAKKAGLSIGSFYAYFSDKKTLLMELIHEYNIKYIEVLVSNINLTPEMIIQKKFEPIAAIQSIIRSALKAYDVKPGFYRMIHALQFSDPEIAKFIEEGRKAEVAFIASMLSSAAGQISIDDIPLTAKILHSTVENVALYIKFLGTDIEEEKLINGVTEMIYKYLYR